MRLLYKYNAVYIYANVYNTNAASYFQHKTATINYVCAYSLARISYTNKAHYFLLNNKRVLIDLLGFLDSSKTTERFAPPCYFWFNKNIWDRLGQVIRVTCYVL